MLGQTIVKRKRKRGADDFDFVMTLMKAQAVQESGGPAGLDQLPTVASEEEAEEI